MRRCPRRAAEILPTVGALVEGPAFHPYLSGRLNLLRLDAADRTADPRTAGSRVDAALDRVGLLAAARKRYRAYSLGMRQRLAIASALLTPKDLLILDEPTNGLDPQGTREVRQLVGSLANDGATVLVSSHLLAEVEQMCTHLGVMHVGRLVAQGTSAELRGHGRIEATVDTDQPADAARVLRELGADRGPHHPDVGDRAARRGAAGEGRRGVRPRGGGGDRVPGRPADARGRVRLAHRGGLRCQWLTARRPSYAVRWRRSRPASCSRSCD